MFGAGRERRSRRWSRGRKWALRIFLVALAMPLVGTSAWVYARMVLHARPPAREAARVVAPPPAPAAPERAPTTEAPATAEARTEARVGAGLSAAPPAPPTAENAPVPPTPGQEAPRMPDTQGVPPTPAAPLGAIVHYPASSAAAFAAATRVAAQLEPAFGRVELVAGAGAPWRTEIRFRSDADHQAARVAGAMLGALGYSWRIAGLARGGTGLDRRQPRCWRCGYPPVDRWGHLAARIRRRFRL